MNLILVKNSSSWNSDQPKFCHVQSDFDIHQRKTMLRSPDRALAHKYKEKSMSMTGKECMLEQPPGDGGWEVILSVVDADKRSNRTARKSNQLK